jgi:hypothetical protein
MIQTGMVYAMNLKSLDASMRRPAISVPMPQTTVEAARIQKGYLIVMAIV